MLVALPGLLCAAAPAPASSSAADRPCSPIIVEAATSVHARWPELRASVQEALRGRDDIDPCARVTLALDGAWIALAVRLPDGRSASRSVARREDVVPTLQGLLLVPDRSRLSGAPDQEPPQPAAETQRVAAVATAATPPASVVQSSMRPAVMVRDMPATAPAPASDRPRSAVRVELAVATGGRLGDGLAGVDAGALSFVEMAGWLAGFEGRVDMYQRFATSTPTGAFELAVLGGRRLRPSALPDTLALDLFAGAAVAVQAMIKSVKQVGSTEPGVTTSRMRADARLRLGARLTFRAMSTLRPFVGVDGDLGRQASADIVHDDLPPLPTWTLGLAVGASVGMR